MDEIIVNWVKSSNVAELKFELNNVGYPTIEIKVNCLKDWSE